MRTVCSRIGEPSSSMNCLRLVPAFSAELRPMRVPRPAAGSMTATFMSIHLRFYRGFLGCEGWTTGCCSVRSLRAPADLAHVPCVPARLLLGAYACMRSSNLPKIILPAVVCSTLVTEMSMVFEIIFLALSTTTMVPSSR